MLSVRESGRRTILRLRVAAVKGWIILPALMMRSKEKSIQVIDCAATEAAIARAAADLAAALVAVGKGPLTLLLSGGSALGILRWWCRAGPGLAQGLAQDLPSDFSHLEVGLLDERWGPPGHAAANERALRETGFVSLLEARGGVFRPLLGHGASARHAAELYESWLETRFRMSKVLATVGVGCDGHTFGLLPQADARIFASLFPQQRAFIAYEHPGKTEHPHRLTLTPSAGRRLLGVYGVALGETKGWVLDLLRQSRLDRPPHVFPAGILWPIPGALYTDR